MKLGTIGLRHATLSFLAMMLAGLLATHFVLELHYPKRAVTSKHTILPSPLIAPRPYGRIG